MKSALIFVFIALILFGCVNSKETNNIHEIWVGNFEYAIYFDSTQGYRSPLTYLIDLTNPDSAIIKYLPGDEYSVAWTISDSLITIDTTKYRIISLTEDSLIYSPYLKENPEPIKEPIGKDELKAVPEKDRFYVFHRVKGKSTDLSQSEITSLLANKTFMDSGAISDTLDWGDYIYFMDNSVSIFKMEFKNPYEIHLQDECWRIETYKGYLFLVFYHNWYQDNGWMNHAYQIIDLSENEFRIVGFPSSGSNVLTVKEFNKNDSVRERLVGKWISINSTEGFQGRYISKQYIEKGFYHLYADTLLYEFCPDSLKITFDGFGSYTCKWKLSPDNSILIMEFWEENKRFIGYHVKYANLQWLSHDSLMFILQSDDAFQTDIEYPQAIFINEPQRLRKIK